MESRIGRIRESFWVAVLTAHLVAAAAWWWLMPGGFPLGHPRFWVNDVIPLLFMAGALAARFYAPARPTILAGIGMGWVAAAVSARLSFPITFAWLWLLPLGAGVVVIGLWVQTFGRRRAWSRDVAAMSLGAALLGTMLPPMIGAAAPATRPMAQASGFEPLTAPTTSGPATAISDPGRIGINQGSGFVTLGEGRIMLGIYPLLTFTSRSPDGCLVLLARRDQREGAERRVIRQSSDVNQVRMEYADDGRTTLEIDATRGPADLRIVAASTLPAAVYSHLNTYTEMTIVGHRRLSVAFSPCADQRIEFKTMDYPVGAPARFAYVDANGIFHVVEARSAEKGPFHELARGPLARGEALTMTFYDEDRPWGRVTFSDWAAQASTQLSPTAGWGVPENAIEFSLQSEDASSPASVFVTLAATSVGRGYDSVGHAPGLYQNRMRVELGTEGEAQDGALP